MENMGGIIPLTYNQRKVQAKNIGFKLKQTLVFTQTPKTSNGMIHTGFQRKLVSYSRAAGMDCGTVHCKPQR